MSRIRHDYLPEEITAGEIAALRSATKSGWIKPPLFCSIEPPPQPEWRIVHLRYLERRGLIAQWQHRRDGLKCIRLNSAGLELRELLL